MVGLSKREFLNYPPTRKRSFLLVFYYIKINGDPPSQHSLATCHMGAITATKDFPPAANNLFQKLATRVSRAPVHFVHCMALIGLPADNRLSSIPCHRQNMTQKTYAGGFSCHRLAWSSDLARYNLSRLPEHQSDLRAYFLAVYSYILFRKAIK